MFIGHERHSAVCDQAFCVLQGLFLALSTQQFHQLCSRICGLLRPGIHGWETGCSGRNCGQVRYSVLFSNAKYSKYCKIKVILLSRSFSTLQVQVWPSSLTLRPRLWCRFLSSGAFVSSWCSFCWLLTHTWGKPEAQIQGAFHTHVMVFLLLPVCVRGELHYRNQWSVSRSVLFTDEAQAFGSWRLCDLLLYATSLGYWCESENPTYFGCLLSWTHQNPSEFISCCWVVLIL